MIDKKLLRNFSHYDLTRILRNFRPRTRTHTHTQTHRHTNTHTHTHAQLVAHANFSFAPLCTCCISRLNTFYHFHINRWLKYTVVWVVQKLFKPSIWRLKLDSSNTKKCWTSEIFYRFHIDDFSIDVILSVGLLLKSSECENG